MRNKIGMMKRKVIVCIFCVTENESRADVGAQNLVVANFGAKSKGAQFLALLA